MRGSMGTKQFGEGSEESQGCQWYLKWGPQGPNRFGMFLGEGVQ